MVERKGRAEDARAIHLAGLDWALMRLVPEPMNGFDGVLVERFQLGSDTPDVGVDGAFGDVVIVLVGSFDQL